MTAANFRSPITADETYVFPRVDAHSGVFQVTLTSGSGTITPGYDDGAGNFVPLRDSNGTIITTTASAAWSLIMPISGQLALTLASSSSAVLTADFSAR